MSTLEINEKCLGPRISIEHLKPLQDNHLTLIEWAEAIAMVKAQLDVVDEVNTYLNK